LLLSVWNTLFLLY